MRKLTIIFSMMICFILGFNLAYALEQQARRTDAGVGYLEYLPPGYETGEKFPLIIFLHGKGENGGGSPTDLEKVKKHGPPKLINAGHNMCFDINGKQEGFIVISPQSYGDWTAEKVLGVLNYVKANYNVDEKRVYLTGLSMGGQGTYDVAGSLLNEPNAFAALAPMAASTKCEVAQRVATRSIPTWHSHGDQDGTVHSYSKSVAVIACMENANPDQELIYTVYEGVGHDCWTRAYRADNSLHTPNLYQWFLQHSLDEVPLNVKVDAGPNMEILEQDSVVIVGQVNSGSQAVNKCWWEQASGVSLNNKMVVVEDKLILQEPPVGTYTFVFKALDNQGGQHSDQMTLNVLQNGTQEVIIDNAVETNVRLVGDWTMSTSGGSAKYGSNYIHDGNVDKGSKSATFFVEVTKPGRYAAYAYWYAYSNRSTSTRMTFGSDLESVSTSVNQRNNGAEWYPLGEIRATDSLSVNISNEGSNGFVIADAIKFVLLEEDTTIVPAPKPVQDTTLVIDNMDARVVTSGEWYISTAGANYRYGANYFHDGNNKNVDSRIEVSLQGVEGTYDVYTTWYAYSNRATNTEVIINHAGGAESQRIDQTNKGEQWLLLGSYTFDENANTIYFTNNNTDGYVVFDAIKLVGKTSGGSGARKASGTQVSLESLKVEPQKLTMNVYPNPTTSVLNVRYTGDVSVEHMEFTIRDMKGVELKAKSYIMSEEEMYFDVSHLTAGIYLVGIKGSNEYLRFYKQ